MHPKTLILTIAQGNLYSEMAFLTHPTIKAYADRIGAEFKVINEKKISSTSIHWEKFQIFDLLNIYDRILFVDTDIIIREDAPNLFDIVPKDKLGMFNEAPWTLRSRELMIDVCKQYGVILSNWDGRYFNTGVMVISRAHKYLFKKPDLEYFSFYEQTYLNMRIAEFVIKEELKIFELEYRFNRMTCMDRFTGEERFASYFIHYAGFPNRDIILPLIKTDIEKWASMEGGYKFKKHIAIVVSGGLGDQVEAEPAIRYLKEKIYPEDDIIVSTHWPRLFEHLGLPVYKHGEFNYTGDTPYHEIDTLPNPNSIQYSVVSHLLCHTADYCAMALLKRILPINNRTIKLKVNGELQNVKSITGDINLKDFILVHAGRHWPSKTMPTDYWQAIIDGLAKNHKVALIGKDDQNRGTVDVKCPDNVIDLRNLLDLGSLIAIISEANVLISNDSAPIHIAGAFDNWIVLLPTCKHPDYVLPYRNGNPYYKALALYKALPSEEYNSQPTTVHGSTAELLKGKWEDYLLSPDEIIERIGALCPVQ
jgi:hypothetical protein